jgi:hypothetical protein
MNAGAKLLRGVMLAGILVAASAGAARAGTDKSPCSVDTDCAATPDCGGSICDWTKNPFTCGPPTGGNLGWCFMDSDCKCAAMGATCNTSNNHCTKVTAGGGGTAGTSGAAGSSTGGSNGTAGSSTGGSKGTAGAGGSGTSTSSSSGGGCSVASTTSGGFASLVGLALVAGRLVRRRRRG